MSKPDVSDLCPMYPGGGLTDGVEGAPIKLLWRDDKLAAIPVQEHEVAPKLKWLKHRLYVPDSKPLRDAREATVLAAVHRDRLYMQTLEPFPIAKFEMLFNVRHGFVKGKCISVSLNDTLVEPPATASTGPAVEPMYPASYESCGDAKTKRVRSQDDEKLAEDSKKRPRQDELTDAAENALGGKDVNALCEFIANGALSQLQMLALDGNNIGDTGMQAFAAACGSGAMANLTKLSLYDNEIGDEGMKAFAAAVGSGAMANLTTLNLFGNKIGDAGMQSFSTAIGIGAIPHLQWLVLADNEIGDDGMAAFAAALANGAIPQLQLLFLSENQIGNSGMQAFAAACGSGALPQLNSLYIDDPSEELVTLCFSMNINLK